MVEILSVPFDLCGRAPGSRLGPVAMGLAGLKQAIEATGQSVSSAEHVVPVETGGPVSMAEKLTLALATYHALKSRVIASLAGAQTPLVVGGDHSVSIGSISGALAASDEPLAVLWIDAHSDFNRPSTSPTGNLHGMPLAALCRQRCSSDDPTGEAWRTLLDDVVPNPGLNEANIAWIGLREVDPEEAKALCALDGAYIATTEDLDRLGVAQVMAGFSKWLQNSGATRLWVSFDVDSLDPLYAPGTGTTVRGGLTDREGHLIAEMLHELLSREDASCRLAGADVVEVNPLRDQGNITARMAVEWVASLFGKTILGHTNPAKATP